MSTVFSTPWFALVGSLTFISCNDDNARLEAKLDSALAELESVKQKTRADSTANSYGFERMQDSLRKLTSTSPQELSVLYEALQSSIYTVYLGNGYGTSQGSAFLVDADGTCVSNYHVFEKMTTGFVRNSKGEDIRILEMLKYDAELDYAIFRIALGNDFVSPLNLASTLPKVGEECFAIGSPKGLTHTLSTGIVSSYRNDGTIIQNTTDITFGSSGGALFNRAGEVIGITTSTYGDGALNFAINIQVVDLRKYAVERPDALDSKVFVVLVNRTNFHNTPNRHSQRSAFLTYGDEGVLFAEEGGYAYVAYTNREGRTTKGWIDVNDISIDDSSGGASMQADTYTVIFQRTYFHSQPKNRTIRSGHLLQGDRFQGSHTRDGFVYATYTSSNGIETTGWILLSDVARL